MAILSDKNLIDAIEKKIISIEPLDANNIQPGSIDLTLHNIIEVFSPPGKWDVGAISKEQLRSYTQEIDISDGYDLEPGAFVTGYSAEKIKLSSFVTGRIFNRNSIVKCGINAALSAFITPGFFGRKVIVIHNFGNVPVTIRSGIRICQLEISELGQGAIRKFDDRHDLSKFNNDIFPENRMYQYTPSDTSLSDFLNECIKSAARR